MELKSKECRILDFQKQKEVSERRKYRDLVLAAFDDMEHKDARDRREKVAEVRRNARNRL